MDAQLQALGVQLAETALRNTAGAVADKISAAKTRKKDQETIAELEEIVSGLLADKSELVRIGQAFEQELVAQRISESDIEYIPEKFIPTVRKLVESAAAEGGQDSTSIEAVIDLLQPMLSVETVTVLQLIGFNFRRAIGEPLTQLVAQLILSRAQADSTLSLEIQRLGVMREVGYLEVARDPEAYARLTNKPHRQAVATEFGPPQIPARGCRVS